LLYKQIAKTAILRGWVSSRDRGREGPRQGK
jgi:hypothetical protein